MPNALEGATGWSTEDANTGQVVGGGTFPQQKPDPLANVPYAPPDINNTDFGANLQRQAIRNLEIQRRYSEQLDRQNQQEKQLQDANIQAMQSDRDKMEAAQGKQGVSPDDLKPWDEKGETAKYTTPPMEQFGSWGMVFAMLASAFTHAPVVSSLNAGAAALKAIQDGDKARYDRAYESWKANTQLMLERHKLEHEKFADALEIFKTDATLGQARLMAAASEFGNERAIFLAQNGLHPELEKMLNDSDLAATNIARVSQEIQDKQPEAQARLQLSKDQKLLEQLHHKPGLKPEELKAAQDKVNRDVEYLRQLGNQSRATSSPNNLRMMEADRLYKQFQDALESGDAEAMHRITMEMNGLHMAFDPQHQGAAGGAPKTAAGKQAEEAERRKQQYIEDKTEEFKRKNGREPNAKEASSIASQAYDQARKEVKTDEAVMTGNRRDMLEAHVQGLEMNVSKIDETMQLIQKNAGSTGLGGKIWRPIEAINNLRGINKTDYGQIESNISWLQTQGRDMFGEAGASSGKGTIPVTEQAKIDKVIRGFNLGDTGDRTLRALAELKGMYEQSIRDTEGRLAGGETPTLNRWDPDFYRPATPQQPTQPSHSDDKWWEAYPLAK